ncbi:MAG: hypothetical protein H6772_03570 [Pseudomonadales bacterium]|nr:hypothetical protein [Pseudomonadales bacterium]
MKILKSLFLTLISFFTIKPVFAQEFDQFVGRVDTPKGVALYNIEAGSENIAILLFFSKFIMFITMLASLWVVINVLMAAISYLTGGGKPDNHQKVKDKLTMSVLGLIIIVSSYTVAGLIGLIFFGDATYIINPTIAPITGA